MIIYMIFVLFIITFIYKRDDFKGIVENIFPFFIDLFLVFLISFFILLFRVGYNDEIKRINFNNKKIMKLNLKDF